MATAVPEVHGALAAGVAGGPAAAATPVRRLIVVDALRGIACLAVMVHHSVPIAAFGDFYLLQRMGHTSVTLFLVLSGFSIHYRWAAKGELGDRFDHRSYWARRFLRIYPSYAFAVVLEIILFVMILGPDQGWHWGANGIPTWFMVMAQILLVTANTVHIGYVTIGWTLAFEIQVYALYSVIVTHVRRIGAVRIVLISLAVAIVWRYACQWFLTTLPVARDPYGTVATASTVYNHVGYTQLPARAFEWMLGLLAAEVVMRRVALPPALSRLPSHWGAAVFGVLFGVISYLFFRPLGVSSLNGNPFYLSDVVYDQIAGVAWFAMLLWAVQHEGALGRFAITRTPLRVFAAVGVFSYSLYLVHYPMLFFFEREFRLLSDPENPRPLAVGWEAGASMIFIWLVIIGFAFIFHVLIERRFLQASQRVGKRSRGSNQPQPLPAG